MLAMSASYKGPKVFQNNWDEVTKFEDSIQSPGKTTLKMSCLMAAEEQQRHKIEIEVLCSCRKLLMTTAGVGLGPEKLNTHK
ncbi:uncharacterized protein LOC135579320 isoform X5 [Columba livia]|uniref:uncharacterized protein LOC135579320 isoform X5 n=1 Tax=Columba livia TaxID=8932 RepID=UPI0031B9F088